MAKTDNKEFIENFISFHYLFQLILEKNTHYEIFIKMCKIDRFWI